MPFASQHAPDATGTPKTLAVIPARLESTRLPGKPLRLVGGVPLVIRVWERVRESGVVDRVVVATDAQQVAAVVRERGGEAILTSPVHPSGTDRVAEVAARPEFAGFGVVVNIQGDEPFVPAGALAGAIGMVRDGRFPLATCATPVAAAALASPDTVKVVCDDGGRALYFSRAPIPWCRDAADAALQARLVRQHVGLYAFTPDALRRWVSLPVHDLERVERLEQLRPLAAGMSMGVHLLDAPLPGGVDTEDDLARANALWDDLYAGRP